MYGIKGFEPLNARTKNECLATWLYSKRNYKKNNTLFTITMFKAFHTAFLFFGDKFVEGSTINLELMFSDSGVHTLKLLVSII